MRSAGTFAAFLPLLLLVVWGGASGCKDHSDCDAIALGTPLASLPHVSGPPNQSTYYGCNQPSPPTEEVALLHCCSDGFNQPVDGGLRRCASGLVDCSKLPPFEVWGVGLPYGDWSCEPQPDFPSYAPSYKCYVWVRDGRVIGRCSGCEPD